MVDNEDSQKSRLSESADLLHRVGELHSVLANFSATGDALADGETAELLRQAIGVCTSLDAGIRNFTEHVDSLREQLAASEERCKHADDLFQLAYENSPFSMALATLDEGRFVDVNSVFLTRLGYLREEVIGKSSAELGIFPESEGRRWLVEGLAKAGQVNAVEMMARRKNGEHIRGRIYARVVMYRGQKCILSLTQNIEEIRRAEEEAQRLRRFYEQLLQDLPARNTRSSIPSTAISTYRPAR